LATREAKVTSVVNEKTKKTSARGRMEPTQFWIYDFGVKGLGKEQGQKKSCTSTTGCTRQHGGRFRSQKGGGKLKKSSWVMNNRHGKETGMREYFYDILTKYTKTREFTGGV